MVAISSKKKQTIVTRLTTTGSLLRRQNPSVSSGTSTATSVPPAVTKSSRKNSQKRRQPSISSATWNISRHIQDTNLDLNSDSDGDVEITQDLTRCSAKKPRMLPSLEWALANNTTAPDSDVAGTVSHNESGRYWKEAPRKPSRATRGLPTNAELGDPKPSKWIANQKRAEEKRFVQALARELRQEMEQESVRKRIEEKNTRERRLANAQNSMVVQKIRRERAMKKLSPHERKRLGIFAQHELKDMIARGSR